MNIAVIGGGPAGLRAAEVVAASGARVTLYEAQPSVGRKFLVAGRGGLNLTNAEGQDRFVARFSGPAGRWQKLLASCDAAMLRGWAEGLGIETFAAGTGRVYPREMKAAPLLRRWVIRLRAVGVQFATRHRWCELQPGAPLRLAFGTREGVQWHEADAAILALGGASWPQTGSDGTWTEVLARAGIELAPLVPANCGWEAEWPAELLAKAEGQPLKNIVARAGEAEATGELLVTSYGLEGGAIYQLGPALRAMSEPRLEIDFKPMFSTEQLVAKMAKTRSDFLARAKERWRLSDAAIAVLEHCGDPQARESTAALAALVKRCPVRLSKPRPIAEAISSAGGVRWSELDENLMLRKVPGVFVAGEMIDWEAPTGGYLIQGCFATGTHAARGALEWLQCDAPQAQRNVGSPPEVAGS